jgi:hypothetical protein
MEPHQSWTFALYNPKDSGVGVGDGTGFEAEVSSFFLFKAEPGAASNEAATQHRYDVAELCHIFNKVTNFCNEKPIFSYNDKSHTVKSS